MDCLSVERRPPLRIVKLNTGKRNVLTLDAVQALRSAIAPDSEAPVVVLSGRSDGFCAGLDNATLTSSAVEREELLARMGELLVETIQGPTRIVVACESHAVAAGAMLLLAADVRIGARGAYKVGFTEPRLGMPLPELPAILARERLDRRRLHELTVLGRTVDPEGARSAGFFDRLAASDRVLPVALESGLDIAVLSDAAYQGTMASVWGSSLIQIRRLVEEQVGRLAAARASAA